MKSLVGRGDLIRALRHGSDLQESLAARLGYELEETDLEQEDADEERVDLLPKVAAGPVHGKSQRVPDPEVTVFAASPVSFWQVTRFRTLVRQDGEGNVLVTPVVHGDPWTNRPAQRGLVEHLASSASVMTRLRNHLSLQTRCGRTDLDEAVAQISRGEFIHRLPRENRRIWGHQTIVIVDRSMRLAPYWREQSFILQEILEVFPAGTLRIAGVRDGRDRPEWCEAGAPIEFQIPVGGQVLALSDLGMLDRNPESNATTAWLSLGRQAKQKRCEVAALFPAHPDWCSPELARLWNVIPWELRRRAAWTADEADHLVELILTLGAIAIRMEPDLVRRLRRLLPAACTDCGLESLIWQHELVNGSSSVGIAVDDDFRKLLLASQQANSDELSVDQLCRAAQAIRQQHSSLQAGVWFEEILSSKDVPAPEFQADRTDAVRFLRGFTDRLEKTLEQEGKLGDAAVWFREIATRLPDHLWNDEELKDGLHRALELIPPRKLSSGVAPKLLPATVSEHLLITQVGETFHVTRNRDSVIGSPIAEINSTIRRLKIVLDQGFDIDYDFWADGQAPSWARAWGIDEFGLWAEFEVHPRLAVTINESASKSSLKKLNSVQRSIYEILKTSNESTNLDSIRVASGVSSTTELFNHFSAIERFGLLKTPLEELPEIVTQRMRWVAAGTFLMGSPEDEPGRRDHEGPQHEVRISRGFWMFDTPCTQALWEAVMGENPSQFQTPDRPVEQVSWDDCQKFFDRLKERVPGLDIALPTEAEWEFACRAGSESESAPYDGAFEILGANNAPALDTFAWYGGNSGVDFELADGVEAGSWSEKQYEFDKAGTHPVAKRKPNRLGLLDMLGNVWEWCQDASRRPYTAEAVSDPVHEGAALADWVIRGGSWDSSARSVRAASRYAYSPGYRDYDIGFRCRALSSGPSRSAAEQAAQGGSPQRAVSRRSPKAEPGGDSEHASEGRPTGDEATRHSGPNAVSAAEASDSSHLAPRDEPTAPLDGEAFLKAAVQHFDQLPKPQWASNWGRDEFGLWAELSVFRPMKIAEATMPIAEATMPISDAGTQIVQWLRLIPPGTFLMGSLADEVGRDSDEGPQHEVTITQAFWIFDSPVTQDLWQAVTGKSPSNFEGGDRPVERVSWEDCVAFNQQLAARISAEFALPTEAEWEHACRGGTATSTWAGTLEPPEIGAGEWDQIAWVSENSESQTHPVRQKAANPWGLFDTLGNVWEWCQDAWQGRHDNGPGIDPVLEGVASADRVIRGGSWLNNARCVRAAYRHARSPGYRDRYIGFRCRVRELRIQQAVELAAAGGLLASREGRASVERRSRKAEPGGDSETASVARAAWINLLNADSDETPIPQSPAVRIVTDVEELTLRKIQKPNWASAIGRDRFGLWCEIEIGRGARAEGRGISFAPRRKARAVIQRLRWIPPGQFLFGSPKDEPGRFDDREFEPHMETISQGFWIFDTPVTQELWEAVCDTDSPANFKSPTRPVEQVSWEDCQQFGKKFAKLNLGIGVRLPSEVEWEYACRAGTTGSTYAGTFEYDDNGIAVALDGVAWYGGNSHLDFELDEKINVSWVSESRHIIKPGGTHPVGLKPPNPWGLKDALGNVWEWCADVFRHLSEGPTDETDDSLPLRVVRGGGWRHGAGFVRAAFRSGAPQDNRSSDTGFRLRIVELREFQSAVIDRGNELEDLAIRPEVLKDQGRLSEALEVYDRIILENPRDVVALYGRAEVLKAQRNLAGSLAAYDVVIAEHPQDAVAQTGRAELLKAQGDLAGS
ncbi:MAG: SUMF1/EgtB/PvdO family nonheme iron enzyme, partial [Rhodopirellula sp.]|nr:SUMF1/EgtB/PvdO family nonheme iron enzyme [Rhodopirellula sp.]